MGEFRTQSVGDEGDWFKCNRKTKNGMVMISSYLQTQTELATHLCIHGPATRLKTESDSSFSIGGTYSREKEDLWFFASTSVCHGDNYLLKLFVMARREVRFSLFLPSIGHNLTDNIKVIQSDKYAEITGYKKEFIFASARKDEALFVKTYRFTKAELDEIENVALVVPCTIQIHTSYHINPDIIKRVKLQYTDQQNRALYNIRNEGTYIFKSTTEKEYPVHLFVAAAHSPVLRQAIKDKQTSISLNFTDDDLEMIVAFLYKGTIETMSSENAERILWIASMLQLPGMKKLGEALLSESITEDNAVEIAVTAKLYELKVLLFKVFEFIKSHPAILMGSGIQRLSDIDLMRAMLQHIGSP